MPKEEKIILGIDPGTTIMGYAIIAVSGSRIHLQNCDVLNLNKVTGHELKLKKIFEKTTQLIHDFTPDEIALEAPFYGKNVQSMLKLGRAQGVAMAAALAHEIPVKEYAPKKVKQAITGNGNASKEQVAAMLEHLLTISLKSKLLDATDALGVAVCHYFNRLSSKTSAIKNWDSFIKENPHRVKK